MRIPILLTLLLTILLTHRTATHPDTPLSHASVLTTTTYALGAGTLVNILCAAGAYLTGSVPGMECEACVPWSVVTVAVTARLHVFQEGGWGKEERGYVKGLGATGARWVLGGPERWFETFDIWEGGSGEEELIKEGDGLGEEAFRDGDESVGEAEE